MPHARYALTSPENSGFLTRVGRTLLVGLLLSLTLLVSACGPGTETGEKPVQPTLDEPKDQPSTPRSNFSAAGLKTEEVQVFLQILKGAVTRGDAQAIASMVAYPITLNLNEETVTIKSPEAFVANYPGIIREPVKQAIQQAEMDRLFVNYQGVRLGQGELWFGGVYKDDQETYQVKILAINN
jgi:hypothetical protein